jgi:hypothetical protein
MTPRPVERRQQNPRRRQDFRAALLETATLYGLLGWIYVAVLAASDMNRLADPLIHWLPLRTDTCGALFFAVSATGFLLLNMHEDGRGNRTRRRPGPDR